LANAKLSLKKVFCLNFLNQLFKGELPPPDQAPTEALRSELANSFGAVMMKGRSSIRGRNRVLQQLNTAGMIEPPGR
jgi:hypothetical protein